MVNDVVMTERFCLSKSSRAVVFVYLATFFLSATEDLRREVFGENTNQMVLWYRTFVIIGNTLLEQVKSPEEI